ncbi:DoxX family protein [Flagellimonas meishanensis]|uniref:DoxX family protein n=1 Tax=Flagellimonas meishanensis TaxID=2873264 RepID=UPI001CA6C99E|nr:DoxX family protein [[Muricauda] meishanensis]
MFKILLKTNANDVTALILRVVLGLIIFAHGAQKLFGIWGGHGPRWTVEAWGQWWGIPALLTYLVILIESAGAILLVFGFLTRIWTILMGGVMLVAVYLVHFRWGFYMNWYMQPQTGEGFEYHLLVLAILIVLFIKGAGKWSLDGLLFQKFG